MPEVMCPCGRPLHYRIPGNQELVEAEIERLGEYVSIAFAANGKMRVFRVPRHWIALHSANLDDVVAMRFEEVTAPAGGGGHRPGAGAGRSSR